MNRQDACSTRKKIHYLWNRHFASATGKMPVPQERKFTICGTGILPVLENAAICEFIPIASE